MSTSADLITQLNALLRLTNTEIMTAETRRAQAATEDIEQELSANADMGRERAQMLADSIRELGGVPDVLGVAAGRVVATTRTAFEQGQDLTEALLGDLGLEHQLLDRTRLAAMIADQLDARPARRTLERLERAHNETIDWIMTRLAEVAVGGPVAVRPTPVQSVIGFGRRVGAMPATTLSGAVNRTIEGAGQVRGQVVDGVRTNSERVRQLVEAAGEIWAAGRDASLKRSEEIAEERGATDQAQALHRRRRELGAVEAEELPIRRYDTLRADAAIGRIERLGDVNDVRTVIAYEMANKDRKGVREAAERRAEELTAELAAAS